MRDEEVQTLLSVGFVEFGPGIFICDTLQQGTILHAEYDKRGDDWSLREIDDSTGKLIRRLRGRNVIALWQEILFNP